MSYLRPGAYVGAQITPDPGSLPDLPRLPAVIGRGSRLAKVRNTEIIRSFVYEEELTFTPVVPYRAVLAHNADQDRENELVELVDDLGTSVAKTKWQFVDSLTIEMDPTVYDINRTYYLDYQSVDRDVQDPIPVDDIRGSIIVGSDTDMDEFVENSDFFIPVTMAAEGQDAGVLEATLVGDDRAVKFGDITATLDDLSLGTIAHAADTAYTHPYSRAYSLVCTAIDEAVPTVRTYTFRWSSTPLSGGNSSLPNNPLDPATAVTVTISVSACGREASTKVGGVVSRAPTK